MQIKPLFSDGIMKVTRKNDSKQGLYGQKRLRLFFSCSLAKHDCRCPCPFHCDPLTSQASGNMEAMETCASRVAKSFRPRYCRWELLEFDEISLMDLRKSGLEKRRSSDTPTITIHLLSPDIYLYNFELRTGPKPIHFQYSFPFQCCPSSEAVNLWRPLAASPCPLAHLLYQKQQKLNDKWFRNVLVVHGMKSYEIIDVMQKSSYQSPGVWEGVKPISSKLQIKPGTMGRFPCNKKSSEVAMTKTYCDVRWHSAGLAGHRTSFISFWGVMR